MLAKLQAMCAAHVPAARAVAEAFGGGVSGSGLLTSLLDVTFVAAAAQPEAADASLLAPLEALFGRVPPVRSALWHAACWQWACTAHAHWIRLTRDSSSLPQAANEMLEQAGALRDLFDLAADGEHGRLAAALAGSTLLCEAYATAEHLYATAERLPYSGLPDSRTLVSAAQMAVDAGGSAHLSCPSASQWLTCTNALCRAGYHAAAQHGQVFQAAGGSSTSGHRR